MQGVQQSVNEKESIHQKEKKIIQDTTKEVNQEEEKKHFSKAELEVFVSDREHCVIF